MNFPFRFSHRPTREEYAAMRDRALVAETKAVLLENIVEHLPRKPLREPRSDKASIIAAKAETTQRLMRMQGRGGL